MLSEAKPITLTEARSGRCQLCHRKLLAHPSARVQDIARLGEEWGGVLVHRSCAVLGGLSRPGEFASRGDSRWSLRT